MWHSPFRPGHRLNTWLQRANRKASSGALLVLVLLLPLWWQAGRWYQAGLLQEERAQVTASLTSYGNGLTTAVNRRLALLEGLYAFVAANPDEIALAAHFEMFARGLKAGARDIRNFVIAPQGINRYVYPLAGNENVVGHNLRQDARPGVRADVQRAVRTGRIVLSGPYELRQGGLGLVAWQAVYRDGRFWGLVSMVLDVPSLLDEAGLAPDPAGLALALRDSSGQLFYGQSDVFEANPVIYWVDLPEGAWELVGAPVDGWGEMLRTSLSLFRGASLIVIGLLAGITYMGLDQQANLARAVQQRTGQLAQELAERRQAEAALQQRSGELALLNRAGQAFTSTLALDEVLAAIVEEIRQVLGVTACSVWLIDSNSGELVCRQVACPYSERVRGWRLALPQGLAGWTAYHRQSLIVPDTRLEPRHFKGVDQITGLDIRSILTVPLRLNARNEADSVVGVLQALDPAVDRFKPSDLALLESLGATAAIAVENARLYEQARQDAETRAALLQVLNHRVRNNLATIIGLLYVQKRRADLAAQPAYQAILADMIQRVQTIAAVHSMLVASAWSPLLCSELAERTIRSALQSVPRHQQVLVDVSPGPALVTPDQAHNLALILSELTANTTRYALAGRETAQITVHFSLAGDTIEGEFRDDGPGYPEAVLRGENHGVGLSLLHNVVRQGLYGQVWLHNDPGAAATIRFKALV